MFGFDLRPLMWLAAIGVLAVLIGVPVLIWWLVTHVRIVIQ